MFKQQQSTGGKDNNEQKQHVILGWFQQHCRQGAASFAAELVTTAKTNSNRRKNVQKATIHWWQR